MRFTGSKSVLALVQRALAFSLLPGAVFTVACHDQVDEQELELAVATHCTLNSDCADPNICVFGFCHAECASSADCPDGLRCVKGEEANTHICQLPSETTCSTTTASCVGSEVCGVDGECRDACTQDADCLKTQVCAQGTCADKSEVNDKKKLPESPNHVGEGQHCTYNSDCESGLACIQEQCSVVCNGNADCPTGETCADHLCVAPQCSVDGECDFGNICTDHSCVAGCRNDGGCEGGSICDKGSCKVGCRNDVSCSAGSICQNDACVIGCRNDGACANGQICEDDLCVAGCHADADCTTGTRCFGSRCVSPVFAGQDEASGIAATDAHLFTFYDSEIIQCPLTGCTPTTATVVETYPQGGKVEADLKSIQLGTGQITMLAQENMFLFIGYDPNRFSGNESPYDGYVELGCEQGGEGCEDLGQIDIEGATVASALRAVDPPSDDADVVYSVLDRSFTFEDVVLASWVADSLDPKSSYSLSGKGPVELETFDRYPVTLAPVPAATTDDDIVAIGWDDGSITAYTPFTCGGSEAPSCEVNLGQVTNNIGEGQQIISLQWSPTDKRLYWLIESETDSGLVDTTVMRCKPDFSTDGSCVPETVFTTEVVAPQQVIGLPSETLPTRAKQALESFTKGQSFVSASQITIGGGVLFLTDDGNVWAEPLPK